jgi:hypothetical protein
MARVGIQEHPRRARRAVVAITIALLAALVGGASPAAAQETEGLIPDGDWTDEQVAEMLALIEETEEVLPATFPSSGTYEEIAGALEPLGFFDFGAVAPGGYYHFINASWFFDDHLIDPEYSESLVYRRTSDGTLELVSAMFMLRPDIAWLPGWHGHPELCFGEDGGFAGITDPENPSCPPGTTQGTTPLMMHVWIVDDYGCDHRFGGIGVSGVHCYHEGHDDHDDHDDDHMDDHADDHADDHMDDHDDDHADDHMDDHADDQTATAHPATPVVAQPTYTG